MAEPEKNPLEKVIDWFSGWKASFDQLQGHIGWLAAVLLLLLVVGVLIWWRWEDIVKRPGVKRFIECLTSFVFSARLRRLCAKIALSQSSRSIFVQARTSARKPILA
jgi:H+/Cl- antiporter ClcA